MGKDNDIIDSMFNSLIQLIGWIIKKLFAFIWWIISGIFAFIWGLISGKKSKSNEAQNSTGEVYSYNDAIRDIEKAQAENFTEEKLEERYNYLFVNTVLNANMSVDEKCKAIEQLNRKIKTFFNGNALTYGRFYISALDVSFKMLEQMYGGQSMIVSGVASKFNSDLSNTSLKDFNTYLADVLTYAGLLYSPNGKFPLNSQILEKYDLPTFALN